MKLLTVSNLFPRPDRPGCGLYNAQLFGAMWRQLSAAGGGLENVCLVPEWRVSQWRRIRGWASKEADGSLKTYFIPVPYLPLIGRSMGADLYALGLQALLPMIQQADVVYASWLYPDGVAVAKLAQQEKKPFWLMALGSDTFHLNAPRRARQIVEACRSATGIVCVWKGLADRLIRAGVDGSKILVAPNGVESKRFRFRANSDVRGRPTVLFVGNLVDVKGPDLFVEMAIQHLGGTASTPSADGVEAVPPKDTPLFVLVGDGPMRSRLQQTVSNAGFSNDILFRGSQSHDDVARLMNNADCLCLSSRSEGMPNVVIEALASGLPVVATDVGAVSDMLKDEPGTWIVPPENSAAMADAVRAALTTAVDRPSMAERAARRYSWDQQAKSILQKIEATL